jgi:hypothetical protein
MLWGMSNRVYLYRLSNRPTAYADRPETISGPAEWSYDVPLKINDEFDGETEYYLGLSDWSDVLYYTLWNRAEFEANK